MLKKIALTAGFAFICVLGWGLYATFSEPGHLYKHTGVFAACPPRPSCVSSVATGTANVIDPILYQRKQAVVASSLESVLKTMPGLASVKRKGDYLHAVFVSPTMRFRDDVELLIGPAGRIEVRSISRFGYEDFGVNLMRVEKIRAGFTATRKPLSPAAT